MTKSQTIDTPAWKLENGAPITARELADEIALVPRTRFWRLSHLALLWPITADPDSPAAENGFADGFVLELVPTPDGIEWLLQPTNATIADRLSGHERTGRDAIMAAFRHMDQIVTERSTRRHKARSR